MKNQPITAKIKRTTKGGITQPILNMGAPVKMTAKAPSVAKNYNEGYPTPGSANKMMAPAPAPTKQVGTLLKKVGQQLVKKGAQRMLPAVSNTGVATTKKAIQKSAPRTIEVVGKTVANPKNTGGGFMNIAKKVMKLGALGAIGYGVSKLGGNEVVAQDKDVKPTVKPTVKPKKKKSYDKAFEDRGERYKNMDKASYIKEAKRQNAVYKKTGKWDVKDSYDSRPKVEKVSTIKTQPISQKKVEIKTKLDPKELQAQVPSGKKTPAAKPTKSQKLRAKGNAVLADKSLSTEDKQRKAQKLRKRYDKTVKREAKRTARKGRKVKYDEATGTGGSIAGNLLRTVTGKRTRDRKKAQVKKAQSKATGNSRQSSKAIEPTKAL
jgi:hypothetical protein